MGWGQGSQWQPPELSIWKETKRCKVHLGTHGGVNYLTVYRNQGDFRPIVHMCESGVTIYPNNLNLIILSKIGMIKNKYQIAREFGNPIPSVDLETMLGLLSEFSFPPQTLQEIRSEFYEHEGRELQELRSCLHENTQAVQASLPELQPVRGPLGAK